MVRSIPTRLRRIPSASHGLAWALFYLACYLYPYRIRPHSIWFATLFFALCFLTQMGVVPKSEFFEGLSRPRRVWILIWLAFSVHGLLDHLLLLRLLPKASPEQTSPSTAQSTQVMTDVNEKLPAPNRIVHEPARLAILTVLSSCDSADFLFLEQVTGLSRGNLSVQLTNLEAAGLVEIRKELVGKRTYTMVALTNQGREEIQSYWLTMDQLRSYRVSPAETPRKLLTVTALARIRGAGQ